ncbi:TonB-dependent receptor [Chitinophaga horti]|uniref:TonB-dependent receptor n=1 Tax=Chitinophaga horti TaxID=2920382 RepID=A0ABY6IXQ7_9BACT|nr:TonB-dependent receptor [Chitinophaga horti]UYQ91192.1 TonB-dependent receptor [Chitinophaga horti]
MRKLFFLCLGIWPCTLVFAQTKDTLLLNGVEVKDNRPEQRKRETAFSTETVGSEYISRHLGGSLMQTLDRLPGVKTIGIGSGQSKPLVRGLGFNRVVVTDKGMKHEGQQWGADHGLELDQFAAGEVTLVKGAASFVYGSDAIAGAIDVKPGTPPAPGSSGGSVTLVGKTNNQLYGGSANLYHRRNKWFADGRFTWQSYADYKVPADTIYIYDFAASLHDNRLRNTAGKELAAHFQTGYLGNKFRSVLYVSNVFSRSGFFANAHGLEPRKVNNELHDASVRDIQLPRQQVNHFKLVHRNSYRNGGHLWELDLAYQHNLRKEHSQYVNHGYMPANYPEDMRIPSDLERQFDKQVFSINAKDNFQLGKHMLVAGFNLERQQNDINGWSFLTPGFTQHTAGAFVYDKLQLSDAWLLHGALRYDYGHIQSRQYTDWFYSGPEKLVRADAMTRTFNSFVWSLGLNYNKEHFFLKSNIGKSFRMPVAKELAANGVNYHYFSYERGNASLSPETSYQFDVAIGYEDDRWNVQLSPFYNYFPNYIYLNPTAEHDYYYGAGNQVFQYAQSRVMRYGAELQAKYQFTSTISTEVAGEYLYAEQLSGDKEGYTLPFSPPPSAYINLTYTPKILKNTYLSADYQFTGAQNNIVPPERKTPGYRLLNIQAGTSVMTAKQAIAFSLQVQNVFNTRYLDHTSFYRLIGLPEAGRNIILTVKIPFSCNTAI